MLPENIDNFPANFTDIEREYLIGSPLLEKLDEEIEFIRQDQNLISSAIPEFGEKFTIDDFKLHFLLIVSRNFKVDRHGVKTNSQVPLADMFNTRNPYNVMWKYDNNRNGFVVEANHYIKKGNELV